MFESFIDANGCSVIEIMSRILRLHKALCVDGSCATYIRGSLFLVVNASVECVPSFALFMFLFLSAAILARSQLFLLPSFLCLAMVSACQAGLLEFSSARSLAQHCAVTQKDSAAPPANPPPLRPTPPPMSAEESSLLEPSSTGDCVEGVWSWLQQRHCEETCTSACAQITQLF